MKNNCRLVRVYIPARKIIRIVRSSDFYTVDESLLPGVANILHGAAQERAIEESEQI